MKRKYSILYRSCSDTKIKKKKKKKSYLYKDKIPLAMVIYTHISHMFTLI